MVLERGDRRQGSAPRRLSLFGYWEWLLGPPRADQEWHVTTELDESGALRFRERIVVCDSSRIDTLLAIPL